MLRVTFDTNLLIDMEEKRDGFEIVQKIVDLHHARRIKICIPAIAASEKLLNEEHVANYALFEKYIKELKINDYEEMMPLLYFGICYYNHALFAGDLLVEQDHIIHRILFPKIAPEHKQYCEKININSDQINPKWRNAKIDVQMIWCHIHHRGDVFITRDNNFFKKEKNLKEKFPTLILKRPHEFLSEFESGTSTLSFSNERF